jgi:uncharacterized membrane protein YfcA
LVGVTTGFVGVGGGFLIVPALVMLARVPVRTAIGTSLAIIALNSAVGFAKYQNVLRDRESAADATTILVFAAIGILGSQLGQRLNARLNQDALRRLFAVVLIFVGLFVILRETTLMLTSHNDHAPPLSTQHKLHSQNPIGSPSCC